MIGIKKKRPFPLINALHTDFGMPIQRSVDISQWELRLKGLQSLGIREAVFSVDPTEASSTDHPPIFSSVKLPTETGISVEVVPTYWLHEGLEAFVQQQPLKAYQDKYVFLRLKEKEPVRKLKGPVFEMRARGYEPVIVDHEPRKFVKFKVSALEYLSDLGCLLQLNLRVLAGAYGQQAKAHAEAILTEGLIQVITTGVSSFADADQIKTLMASSDVISALEQTIEKHTALLSES